MIEMKICETCDHWFPMGDSSVGSCHRYPPMPYPMPVQQSNLVGGRGPQMGQVTMYPVLNKDEPACGEWSNSEK